MASVVAQQAREMSLRVALGATTGRCLEAEAVVARVKADRAFARSIGVTGTPAFLIGWRTAEGKVSVQEVITGAAGYGFYEDARQVAQVST